MHSSTEERRCEVASEAERRERTPALPAPSSRLGLQPLEPSEGRSIHGISLWLSFGARDEMLLGPYR